LNTLLATLIVPLVTAGFGVLPGHRRPKAAVLLAGINYSKLINSKW